MVRKEYTTIKSISVHKVGNKQNEEEIAFSKSPMEIDEDLKAILIDYFLSSFKSDEYYRFYHDVGLSLNEVYTYVAEIFERPDSLHKNSENLAKHLYNQSLHPKIKGGEFYIVYFTDCNLKGQTVDVVGLFKSENKDTFLEIKSVTDGFDIESSEGININKLDKGCLIFNTEGENGYVLSIVDNTNKGIEAQYWKDDFLSVSILNNEFHQTSQFLGITKSFVTKQMDEDFEISKADKIDLLNRSVEYFKKHDQFDKQEFEEEVLVANNVIESFRKFDQIYRDEYEVELADNFEISAQAVKKQARVFKSVLKLDKNFHIYIHGDRELIEQGVDHDGRKYYKIYYYNET